MKIEKSLKPLLVEALFQIHQSLVSDYPNDPIRAFGIYASNEGDSIEPFFHLQSQLEAAASGNKNSLPEDFVLDDVDYELSSRYESLFEEANEIYRDFLEKARDPDEAIEDVYKVMLKAIRQVDRKGLFGKGKSRESVFLFLHTHDMADVQIQDFATTLNPKAVCDWALGEIGKPEVTGTVLPIGKVAENRFHNLALTSDGSHLAISGWSGKYSCWETKDFNQPKIRYNTHKVGYTALAICDDGRSLYLAWRDSINQPKRGIIEVQTPKNKRTDVFHSHNREVWALAVQPKTGALVVGEDHGRICIWDTGNDQPTRLFKAQRGAIRRIVFNSNGTCMLTASRESGVKAWNTTSWECVWSHARGTEDMALAWDQNLLACVPFGDTASQTLLLLHADSGKPIREIALADGSCEEEVKEFGIPHLSYGAGCIALSSDGKQLAVGVGFGEDSAHVRLYDISSGEKLGVCYCGYDSIQALAFLPGDQCIAITGNHNRGTPLYLWTPGV